MIGVQKVLSLMIVGGLLGIAAQGAAPPGKKKNAANSTSKKGRKATPGVYARQLNPTPDRYKQIQQALAQKGYLPTEQANGQWTEASADALKKFQTDQNLDPTGKINSLSLIALGLGPKHETPPPKE
jgi:peptidoglycan hydrolase-like protein with peptidoglycan-binding domain